MSEETENLNDWLIDRLNLFINAAMGLSSRPVEGRVEYYRLRDILTKQTADMIETHVNTQPEGGAE